ncbi:MAG: ankyrin repeat domain-containing protein [Alphaproteobacteria bacterium]|nr:ankyrin repeat domain-containing protein [Alphaproteobacteria bacterium]
MWTTHGNDEELCSRSIRLFEEISALDCDVELCLHYIDKGVDVDMTGGGREDTLLMRAALCDRTTIINALIDKGANVNTQNESGATALMFAAFHGNIGSLNLLLSKGGNANAKDKWGTTALMYTVKLGNIQCAHALLNHGADIDAKNDHGETAEEIATMHKQEQTAKTLREESIRQKFSTEAQKGTAKTRKILHPRIRPRHQHGQ